MLYIIAVLVVVVLCAVSWMLVRKKHTATRPSPASPTPPRKHTTSRLGFPGPEAKTVWTSPASPNPPRKPTTDRPSPASPTPPPIAGVETPRTEDDSPSYDRDDGQECAHSVSVYCGSGRGSYYG